MDTLNIKSPTWFDRLPNEIIFLIFDYLSNNDIIYTFFFFSERLKNLLLGSERYLNHLELPRENLNTWKKILSFISPQVKSLNINSVNISFPLTYFSNLKSLIISSPLGFANEELKSIFESNLFVNLHSFEIQVIPRFSVADNLYSTRFRPINTQEYILKKVFDNTNSLTRFEYSLGTAPLAVGNSSSFKINYRLHSLTLILTDFKDIYSLLSYTPNLEYLNLQSDSPYYLKTSYNRIDIQLKKLYLKLDRKERTDNVHQYWYEPIDFDQLTNFIEQFASSLIYLSLDLSQMRIDDITEFPFNSTKLQQLLEKMIKLQQFHLNAWIENDDIDEDGILATFNNQFWSDHNWSFGMHENCFFTLPYHFDHFEAFSDVKSNNPEILVNNLRLWYSIKSINLAFESVSDYNYLKQLQIKMPHLNTMNFVYCGYPKELAQFNEENQFFFSNVTAVYFYNFPNGNAKDLFTSLLPNLKHFILGDSDLPLTESELVSILNRKIQHLDISINFIKSDFEKLIKPAYVYFSNVECIHLRLCAFFGISDKEGGNIILEILKNFQNLKILIIYTFETTTFNRENWNQFTKYLDMNEIMKMYRVKIFERYVVFSKETFEA